MAPDRPKPTCAEVAGLIDAYVDDDLGTASASRVRAHLNACGPCRHAWERAVEVKQELNTLPPMRCPDAVMDRVMAEIAPGTAAPRRRIWFAAPLGLAAAAAMAIGVPMYLLRPVVVDAPVTTQPIAQTPEAISPEAISPEKLAEAEAQLKWTLAYIGRVNRDSAEAVHGHLAGMDALEPARDALTILLNLRGDSAAAQES